MKNKAIILITFVFIFITSCEDKDQITGDVIEPDLPVYIQTDMSGYDGGDSEHLGNLYYNFLSNDSYNHEFYKFNNYHLSGGSHSPSEDLLTLKTYQSVYYVPASSISGENDSLVQYENEYFCISCCSDSQYDNVNDCVADNNTWTSDSCSDSQHESEEDCIADNNTWTSDYGYAFNASDNISELELDASSTHLIEDSLLLTSTVFSVLDSLIWNPSSNRYSFATVEADKDTAVFQYSQNYDSVFYATLVDIVLNEIYGDIVLLDTSAVVERNFTEYDTLEIIQDSETYIDPVKIKRSKTFEINDIFVRNNSMMFRENTDCNNNYQQDYAEKLLEDFEAECLADNNTWTSDSCSDSQYESEEGCIADNNSWVNDSCSDLQYGNEDDCIAGNNIWINANCSDAQYENENDCIADNESWIDDGCDSYCSSDSLVTLTQMCWDEYTDSNRLTGHCVVNSIQNKTFCDTGNNLYDDSPEIFYDADESGGWNLSGQDMEPWEDRNCNDIADISATDIESELEGVSEVDCPDMYGTWDSNLSICFLDEGNQQWDDKESCYTSSNCDTEEDPDPANCCPYKDLYKRADAPDVIMFDYADNQNPQAILSAYPNDTFNDCGSDNTCNENEANYNYGVCDNNFSGSIKDCCKYYECWNYSTEDCDFDLISCPEAYSDTSDMWIEELDPVGDDLGGDGSQKEGNGIWDDGEELIKDFNNDGVFSNGTYLINKTLDYSDCNDNCGGDTISIIEDSLRFIPATSFVGKVKSEVQVSSFNVIDQLSYGGQDSNIPTYLNDFNIVKTDFVNTSGNSDYDYMLFVKSDAQDSQGMHYIIKLIHPYYFFAPGYWNMGDVFNVSMEDFWASLHLEEDTLLYSLNGLVIDGQTHYSSYAVESDTANYQVHKEYVVSKSEAVTSYELGTIDDCFKVTRTITTTMFGSGLDFKLKTETYLKTGFPLVKEDVYIQWAAPPWIGDTWLPISSIEFKQSRTSDFPSSNIFSNKDRIDLNTLNLNSDFDFKPFRFSNTIGLQRIEYPND